MDSEDINTLKRQREIEKLKADIQKVKDGENKSGYVNGQTTVTSVFIDQSGYKYATLQFVDGSSLDVETGAKVGKFTVADITMNGVSLKPSLCKADSCTKTLIKRSYAKIDNKSNSSNSLLTNSNPYAPTPIMNVQVDQNVPPIVAN